jgi:4-amino-4-deoxy-L-arabinose transferase-like glycosyltransferase
MMSSRHRFLSRVILLSYLVLGGLYAVYTPAWQAPDEPAHYNYVRHLATRTAFPELVQGCYDQAYLEQLTSQRFPPELSIEPVCYEYHQPPLYYLLAGPIYALTGGSLLALRLFSVALGAGVVRLALAMGRTVFPRRPELGLGAMALVALVPMHLAMLASVNNDALAELLLAALLLVLSRRLVAPGRGARRGDIGLGILLGLGLLTKTTVYIALPLAALTLWWARPKQWGELLRQAGLVFGLALLVALPWYLRNARLYGPLDLLGLGRHDEVVAGQLRTVEYLAGSGWGGYLGRFISTTFHSFWGQFGWMAVPMDGRTYLLLALLTLLALGGLIGWGVGLRTGRIRLRRGQGRALGLMAVTIGLMALGYGWYNLTFVQFQGRYLFPALIPLGLFFAVGLWEALSDCRAWWLAGGLALALIWVVATGVGTGGPDKWALLWVGLAFLLAAGRAWLQPRRPIPAGWLAAACYGGLGLLAFLSPFWFVVPHLAR